MGSDSPRNRVFTPPRGKWKRKKNLSFFFTTPYSTVFQGRRSEEEFTSTAGSSRKEPPPLRSLRPTTFSLSAVLYSAYTTVRPSRCQRLNARPWPNQPRKRCRAPGQDVIVTRVRPSMHSFSGRTSEVTLIQSGRRPLFNHKIIRTRTEYRLRARSTMM